MIQFIKLDTEQNKATLFDGSKPHVHWSNPVSTNFISYMNLYWISDKPTHEVSVEQGGPFFLLNLGGQKPLPKYYTVTVIFDEGVSNVIVNDKKYEVSNSSFTVEDGTVVKWSALFKNGYEELSGGTGSVTISSDYTIIVTSKKIEVVEPEPDQYFTIGVRISVDDKGTTKITSGSQSQTNTTSTYRSIQVKKGDSYTLSVSDVDNSARYKFFYWENDKNSSQNEQKSFTEIATQDINYTAFVRQASNNEFDEDDFLKPEPTTDPWICWYPCKGYALWSGTWACTELDYVSLNAPGGLGYTMCVICKTESLLPQINQAILNNQIKWYVYNEKGDVCSIYRAHGETLEELNRPFYNPNNDWGIASYVAAGFEKGTYKIWCEWNGQRSNIITLNYWDDRYDQDKTPQEFLRETNNIAEQVRSLPASVNLKSARKISHNSQEEYEETWKCSTDVDWKVMKSPIYSKTIEGQLIEGKYWYQLQVLLNSEVAGEFIGELKIDNESFNIGAQFWDQDESLLINLQNQGLELSNLIGKAIYSADLHNESMDFVMLNRKFKELLLNYMDIHGNKGSYESLFNSLKWFEYGKLVELREVWRFLSPDGAKYYDRNISQWFTEEVKQRYFNSARTTSFYLRHMINGIDGVEKGAEEVELFVVLNKGVKRITYEIDGVKYVCEASKLTFVPKGVNITWEAEAEDHYKMPESTGSLTTVEGINIISPVAEAVKYDLKIILNPNVKQIIVKGGEATGTYTSSTTVKVSYGTSVTWTAIADEFYNMNQESGSLTIIDGENIISPTAKPNLYELRVVLNSNVRRIVVSGGEATGTYVSTKSVMVSYGTVVSWTAEAEDHYLMNQQSGSLTITAGENIISPTASIMTFDLKIVLNSGVNRIVVSGGEATGTYTTSTTKKLPYGTVVSWTATAQEHYSMNQPEGSLTIKEGENIISPTAVQSQYPLHIQVNPGVNKIVTTGGLVGTYGATITIWMDLGKTVSWSATANSGYTLSAYSGSVTIIAGDNYISPTAAQQSNQITTPPFEYANFTISWYDGGDLDIFAGVTNPTQFVGKPLPNGVQIPITFHTRGSNKIPSGSFLGYAGGNRNGERGVYVENNFGEFTYDDTSAGSDTRPGVEGIYLNFSKESENISKAEAGLLFKEGMDLLEQQGIEEIQFDIWGHWWRSMGYKDIKVEYELYQDGKMVKTTSGNGFKYVNQGGECVLSGSKMVSAPTYCDSSIDGAANRLMTFKYNIYTGQANVTFGS